MNKRTYQKVPNLKYSKETKMREKMIKKSSQSSNFYPKAYQKAKINYPSRFLKASEVPLQKLKQKSKRP